jgi:hypothetical protein
LHKSPSENGSTKDRCAIPMAWKAVLIVVAFFQVGLSRADDRPATYLRQMRILACVKAENAVRERLKNEGQVSFESCASDEFEFDPGSDDRDYKVSGYATFLSRDARPVVRRYSVDIKHEPFSYQDWGFGVTRIEIDP